MYVKRLIHPELIKDINTGCGYGWEVNTNHFKWPTFLCVVLNSFAARCTIYVDMIDQYYHFTLAGVCVCRQFSTNSQAGIDRRTTRGEGGSRWNIWQSTLQHWPKSPGWNSTCTSETIGRCAVEKNTCSCRCLCIWGDVWYYIWYTILLYVWSWYTIFRILSVCVCVCVCVVLGYLDWKPYSFFFSGWWWAGWIGFRWIETSDDSQKSSCPAIPCSSGL